MSGGTGKTPFTIFLAKYLQQKGFKIAVSHRGYKGDFENTNILISDAHKVFEEAKNAGDESYLLALKLNGIPVIVGSNRQISIRILEKRYPELDYIILDDSFQKHSIKKDFEFVIFKSTIGIGNGFVLPAGFLRESLKALKFADYFVINGRKNIELPINKPRIYGH